MNDERCLTCLYLGTECQGKNEDASTEMNCHSDSPATKSENLQ